jgi:hypothetical protein
VFLVFVQLAVFALLTQLDAMPLGGGFEAREPSLHRQFFAGKKTFEGFGQPISKGLYRCGGNMLAATSLKAGSRPDVSGSCLSPPCLKAGALWPPKVEAICWSSRNTLLLPHPEMIPSLLPLTIRCWCLCLATLIPDLILAGRSRLHNGVPCSSVSSRENHSVTSHLIRAYRMSQSGECCGRRRAAK